MKSFQRLLTDVLKHGESHDDRTGVGTTSVFGRDWRHDMRTGFPLLTTKFVPLRLAFEELRWMLSGSVDVRELQRVGVGIWDEWQKSDGTIGPGYGKQFRDFGGVDQIATLMQAIKDDPGSRRLLVNLWNPKDIPNMILPPCHYGFQIKCHQETREMSLKMTMRSTDIFLGAPFNIAGYGLLLHMIAYVTGYRPRDLIVSFADLHLYNNHLDQAFELLSRKPYPLPQLRINEIHVPENATGLDRLLNLTWENIVLDGYRHHPKIKAPVAV